MCFHESLKRTFSTTSVPDESFIRCSHPPPLFRLGSTTVQPFAHLHAIAWPVAGAAGCYKAYLPRHLPVCAMRCANGDIVYAVRSLRGACHVALKGKVGPP